MDKSVKAMLKISDVLDDRYQKLSDKYHDLELSHNRKNRALRGISSFLYHVLQGSFYTINDLEYWQKVCEDAFFCDGRCNCRPIVQRKKKGGAK